MSSDVISAVADHLRDKRNARVVTWNARGIGSSDGGNELSGFVEWMGMRNCDDYKVWIIFSRENNVNIMEGYFQRTNSEIRE